MTGAGKKNPFFSGFLVGLFAGLALAVTVAVLITRNNPFVSGSQEAGGPPPSASPAAPAEAPKYEFYQALPEGQPGSMPAAPADATVYFLQAGAYGNAAEADQLKARLALLGYEAKILSAQEGETLLHKVRIGPYKSLDELNTARARLTQSGVETILVKTAPKQQEEKR